jgi:uncharacterized phiE125 gp8 family phage protein
MKFQTQIVTAPSITPVSVAEAKEYLRIDNALEDTRIGLMIETATSRLENETSLKFIDQVWDIFTDHFPYANRQPWWDGVRDTSIKEILGQGKNITLPLGKAKELIHFSTFADDNVELFDNISNYTLDAVGFKARVGLKLGGVWPTTVLRANNGIKFRLKFGFGTTTASVPAEIRMAILELVGHMYENRGDQNEMIIPAHILTLIFPYRRMKLENC